MKVDSRFFFDLIVRNGTFFLDLEQGSWVLGGGWNHDLWGGELPAASWIDNITTDNPVRSHNLICTC